MAANELDELTQTSQRDSLTGTPNRAVMFDLFDGAITWARRRGTLAGGGIVSYLDRFKEINDSLGHAAAGLFGPSALEGQLPLDLNSERMRP